MSNRLDILGDNVPLVNKDFVITLPKDNSKRDHELQPNCKIMKFTEEWNFEEVLIQISKLDPTTYQALFIFIIETSNASASIDTLKTFLINFGASRSLILQFTVKSENTSKFYFKKENCEKFLDVDEQKNEVSGDFGSFSSFLLTYLNKTDNFESIVTQKIANDQNWSLILKFLRILELPDDFVVDLVLKCAAEGSTLDLLAAADAFMDDKGTVCGNELKYIIRFELNSTSVLLIAIENSNQEVVDFLIRHCTTSIQQLPFEHKVLISSLTFNTNKVEVLCNLLEIADFPFPEKFNSDKVTDRNLQKIINGRTKFHQHILSENNSEIKTFEEKHPYIKFAYNLENKSALGNALDSKKFESFYFLKSLRFCDRQIENFEYGSCDVKDKRKASKIASKQRKENVEISEENHLNTALILATKSKIYHRNKNNEAEHQQRMKIREWFEGIYATKYGSKLLDAAAQCDKLQIIFDFECESTKNADPSANSQSLGSTYPVNKWIFIGAKFTGEKEREQVIKGVIAHEICHYVMSLVYQNNEKPYYENNKCARKKLDEVVAEIKSILFPSDNSNNEEDIDDECDGIISTVYNLYEKKDWHPELIVRPVQIQVQFDDNEMKYRQLEDIYKVLFAFFELFVILKLKKFNLYQRKKVQMFNNLAGILKKIQELDLKFLEPKDLKGLMKNQLTVVTTNVPKLFLSNISEYLQEKDKKLFDVNNIFMTSNILKYSYAYENFKDIINQDQDLNLNIIVDCTEEFGKIIDFVGCKHKFIFVVSDEKQQEELSRNLRIKNLNTVNLIINYDWMDLTVESKRSILDTKVNFQNNSTISLSELINNHDNKQDQETLFDKIVLNLLLNNNGIIINQFFEEDISDKYLRITFQSRDFIKNSDIRTLKEPELNMANQIQYSKESIKIEQDQMIEKSKNLKFILISDKAGSGKSWILKTFTSKLRVQYPKSWIAYVDLKQFIREFKTRDTEFEFVAFMTEKILKLKTKYEAKIFDMLYKNGKVCILFDGFDEIAPDCAEFVTKLFQSFVQNGGNQLWIATREYFEVNLKEKLGLDAVYKLHEFTDENGINLIASSWLFDELYSKGENYNEIFGIKHSESLQKYKIMAKKINEKIPKSKNDSIGLPQFYKMIADISKNNKDLAVNFTTFKIFEECVDIQYERWSREKGELRSKANVKSQHMDLNYHKLHQLVAMESLFPDETEFCGLSRADLMEWIDEEIIACSLLIKKFGKFLFSHETFREYYAAKFILENLPKYLHLENVCKFLLQFLTVKKFGIIRMFLNDAFGEGKFSGKIMLNIPKIAKNFDNWIQEFESSSDLFEENFQNLADFVIKIFTYTSKEKIKEVLLKNQKITLMAANHTNLFLQIQNMILDYFNEDELKDFLLKDGMFFSIIVSIPDSETTEDFISTIKHKTKNSPEFISQALQITDEKGENIFFYLFRSKNGSSEKFKGIIEILKKILSPNEIIDLACSNNKYELNALQIVFDAKNVEKMRFMWTELEKLNELSVNLSDSSDSMELFSQIALKNNENFLHIAAKYYETEFHETLWELLLNIFKNQEELKDLIMQEDLDGDNFVHLLVIYDEPKIIEFSIRKIKENFSNDQYVEILKSKGQWGNLLLQAAYNSKAIKTHQFLWKVFRDFCKSDKEYLEILKEADIEYNNIFHIAAAFSTKEIFEFIINELEKIASTEEIKNILRILNSEIQNLLQSASVNNESVEFHEILWKIMKKYFNSQELLDMVMHTDEDGNNILFNTVQKNTAEVLKITWSEIENIINLTKKNSTIQEYLRCVNNYQENILHVLIKSKDLEKLKFVLPKFENYFSRNQLKEIYNQKTSEERRNVLHYAALSDEIEFHETLWELLLSTFENRKDLMYLILQKDKDDKNFVHDLVINDNPEIIDFTFRKIKENFKNEQYQKILKSKGHAEGN